ncbi:uridine kinase [Marinomonas sp. CT5]|uniref:uridine kinase n=1 Tax=Marinomonas sp. CT5 TaxID=2066133 RepID=UPI001BAFBFB2|nr:uridine kinase [Marinomonas sp. CT5]QUX97394.1 uridine kinase [Marinomonas sp. CT5]
MLNRMRLMLSVFIFAFFVGAVSAETDGASNVSNKAELFGLPFNDLSLSLLERHLKSLGLQKYPSYKAGVVSYSLGPKGILGVTNATIYSNTSGYIHQALLSGVIESSEDRQALGELLEKKYGTPGSGQLKTGVGRAKWLFDDDTSIELHNDSYDVSITYIDEKPMVDSHTGEIDVEALLRKNQ